jgi:tetratricopeptide (TPR) repeat protein
MSLTTSKQIEYLDKRRVRINMRLLNTVLVSALLAGGGMYLLREYQVSRNAGVLRRNAEAAFEAEKFDQALQLMRRYLMLRATDVDAMLLLADWSDQSAATISNQYEAYFVFGDFLNKQPKRADVRRRVIRLAMKLGRYQDVLKEHLPQMGVDIEKDAELSYLQGQCHDALGQWDLATNSYARAIELAPEVIEHYAALTGVVDRHGRDLQSLSDLKRRFDPKAANVNPDEDEENQPDPKAVCELVTTLMVERAKPTFQSHLERARYLLKQNNTAAARSDVEVAMTAAPKSADVLLTATEVSIASMANARLEGEAAESIQHFEAAHQLASRGLELDPPDLRFHLTIARLEFEAGKVDDAEKHLREGLEVLRKLKSNLKGRLERRDELRRLDFRLNWSLANVLIAKVYSRSAPATDPQFAEIRQIISYIRDMGARSAVLDFLEARRFLVQRKWAEAARMLEDVRSGLAEFPDAVRSADLSLVECYERLLNLDARQRAYRRALNDDPAWLAGKLGLAETLVAMGRDEEAIRLYMDLIAFGEVPTAIVTLRMRQQLARPEPQRDWKAIEEAVALIEKSHPGSPETIILRVELLFQQKKFEEIDQALSLARQQYPANMPLLVAQFLSELRRTDLPEEARYARCEKLLTDALASVGDRPEIRLARAQLLAAKEGSAAIEAVYRLSENADAFDAAQKYQLYRGLADLLHSPGLNAQRKALGLLHLAQAASPENMELTMRVATTAAATGDDAAFRAALEKIRDMEGPEGANGHYVEAAALLRKAQLDSENSTANLERAQRLLIDASRQRPSWAATRRMLGSVEMALGNREQSYVYFRQAWDLGDRSQDTVLNVIDFLYRHGRDPEILEAIKLLALEAPQSISSEVQRYVSIVHFRAGQFDEALSFTKPIEDGAADFRDLIIRAQILMSSGKSGPEVDRLLEQATTVGSEIPQTWYMRVVHLVRTGRTALARKVIFEAIEKVPPEPLELRPLTLAILYETVGDLESAEQQFQQAYQRDPRNLRVINEQINFYIRTSQHDKARAQLARLMDDNSGMSQAVRDAARRTDALLLAAGSKTYEEVAKALSLLGADADLSKVPVADLRAQASILTRSRLRRDQIRLLKVLEEISRQDPLTLVERVQQARLYELTDRWHEAYPIYRKLMEERNQNPLVLAAFINAVVSRKTPDRRLLDEANVALQRLEVAEPNAFRTAIARARVLHAEGRSGEAVPVLTSFLTNLESVKPTDVLREFVRQGRVSDAVQVLQRAARVNDAAASRKIAEDVQRLLNGGDEQEALALLNRFVSASDVVDAMQSEFIKFIAGLFELIEQPEAAESAYRQFVMHSTNPEAVLVLSGFLARRGRIDEALAICDEAEKTCRPTAVARVAIGVLRAGKPVPQQVKRVEQRIIEALNTAEEELAANLSLSLADLRDFQGKFDEAASIYRRLLDKNESHVVALNNLAWIVSFRPVGKEAALELIDRAVLVAGPIPDLLDTRAVVYMNLDRPKEAIRDLEQALEEVATASIWFHMALAQRAAGNLDKATEAFRKAEEAGLEARSLHPLELDQYNDLKQAVGQDRRSASGKSHGNAGSLGAQVKTLVVTRAPQVALRRAKAPTFALAPTGSAAGPFSERLIPLLATVDSH